MSGYNSQRYHEPVTKPTRMRKVDSRGADIIENQESKESRKSIENEKLKVETEKKVSEAALKRD